MIEIIPLMGIGEGLAGADLAYLLHAAMLNAGIALVTGDILVVTQKIVSKA